MANNNYTGLDKLTNKQKKPAVRDLINQSPESADTLQTTQPTTVAVPEPEKVSARAEDKKRVNQLVTTDFTTPKNFNQAMEQINSLSTELPEEEQKLINQKLSQIDTAREKALNQFQKNKDTAQWAKLAETIGQALVKLGAGAYGLKHNVDTSGIKFDKADWESALNQDTEYLKQRLGTLRDQEERIFKDKTALERKLAKDTDFVKRAILQNFLQRQRENMQAYLQAQRLAERAKARGERQSPEAKAAEQKLLRQIKEKQKEVQTLDKAYAEAQAIAEGEGKASMESLGKILGGERGAQARKKATTPGWFWDSLDKSQVPKVVKGWLEQEKTVLDRLENLYYSPEKPAELSEADKQALQWANDNPDNPKAKLIKQTLGQ